MVETINLIVGKLVLILSLFRIYTSTTFRNKYSTIKIKILNSNENKLFLPQDLIKSIVIIEDRRYFHHLGIDFYSIVRAILRNTFSYRMEGASTINQQLVRSITNDIEVSFVRKLNEIMFAVLIDKEFEKREILSAYAHLYQFYSCVGISDFCAYENYNLGKLKNYEYSEIAARFKYPKVNKLNYIKFLKRVRTIEMKKNPIIYLID
jgi:membrane carboxypeptidase/penicillin-binding protein